jgi:hypothetical protein
LSFQYIYDSVVFTSLTAAINAAKRSNDSN